jgi:hypothetical protein
MGIDIADYLINAQKQINWHNGRTSEDLAVIRAEQKAIAWEHDSRSAEELVKTQGELSRYRRDLLRNQDGQHSWNRLSAHHEYLCSERLYNNPGERSISFDFLVVYAETQSTH